MLKMRMFMQVTEKSAVVFVDKIQAGEKR